MPVMTVMSVANMEQLWEVSDIRRAIGVCNHP